ncbi:MAG TPA: succinyldiaminopimelate transaminase [Gammaproteobacteria bacterium]
MNPDIERLQSYPFEKLQALKTGVQPPAKIGHIALSLGEPQHAAPAFIAEAIQCHLDGLQRYPLTRGTEALRNTIRQWLFSRYRLPEDSLDADTQIAPVNGSREGLFSIAQALVDRSRENPLVLLPNPFYQIYEGAALLAGAKPFYYPTPADNGYAPDFTDISDDTWHDCQLIYVCSPGNPTGHVVQPQTFRLLLEKAAEFGFTIVSDECYSEIYFDENSPPPGLLQIAHESGVTDFRHCVVFNSLSKRSNLPGLRSGFVAGDAQLLKTYLHYRTYHGCAMSETIQHASIAAWRDEAHVKQNREVYRRKFATVIDILSSALPVRQPDAAFFLWLQTPIDDQQFARELYARQNVTVLPGSYLSRGNDTGNPGESHVRIALVAEEDQCVEAAQRIKQFLNSL